MIIYAWVAISFDYYYLTRDNAFVSRGGGLRIKSRGGQIWPSVATQHFFEGAVLHGRNDAEMGTANSLHASVQYSKLKKKINWFDLN